MPKAKKTTKNSSKGMFSAISRWVKSLKNGSSNAGSSKTKSSKTKSSKAGSSKTKSSKAGSSEDEENWVDNITVNPISMFANESLDMSFSKHDVSFYEFMQIINENPLRESDGLDGYFSDDAEDRRNGNPKTASGPQRNRRKSNGSQL